jgi:integrase
MKLTNRTVEALPVGPEGGGRWTHDDELPGLVLIAYPRRKAWGIRFTVRGTGTRRFMLLGDFPVLTSETARRRAKVILAAASEGHDLVLQAREKRKAALCAAAVPRFGSAVVTYLGELEGRRKRPDVIAWYLSRARKTLENRRLDEITRADVAALHQSMRKTPTTANRVLMTLSGFFTKQRRAGLVGANPCQGIELFTEAPPRDRVLSTDELQRLTRAIDEEADPNLRACFRLLLETGCRVGEVLAARWADINLDQMRWRLPSPKSGREQWIPVHESTVEWLRTLPRSGAFVIPGRPTGEPGAAKRDFRRFDIKRPWERIREKAELEGVTIHDLRRTVLSLVARASGPLVAQRLGRHADLKTTIRHYLPQEEQAIREGIGRVLPFMRRSEG